MEYRDPFGRNEPGVSVNTDENIAPTNQVSSSRTSAWKFVKRPKVLTALALVVVGTVLLAVTLSLRTNRLVASLEVEKGSLTGAVSVKEDPNASGGKYVTFEKPEPVAASPADADVLAATTATRAFPGAQGFGTETKGGRGGRVIEVTNLNDSGPGSFRAAVMTSGPRIVVFRVAGTISLDSRVEITEPFLTIAGQTAPGEGITLRSSPGNPKGTMYIVTHDVIMRYLRLRPGTPATSTSSHDALTIWNSSDPNAGAYNIVVDHCSFSWAVDENLATYHNARNITFSWNITSEALSNNKHPEGEHSKGFHLSGDNSGNISAHHNLIAHNTDRNPQPTNPGIVDIRNNVVYDYGKHAMFISNSKGKPFVNVVGNYYKNGPSSAGVYELEKYSGSTAGHAYFVKGNIGPHRTSDSQPDADFVGPSSRDAMVTTPFAAPAVTTSSAAQAYTEVLAGAGTSRDRDAVDDRVVNDVRNGTGRIIDSESQVGGWPVLKTGTAPADADHDGMPDAWESANGLNAGADDSAADRNGDGYTNVEEYVNGLAAPAPPDPTPTPEPDPTPDPTPTPVSCSTTAGTGIVSTSVTLPEDNNYRIWARMKGVGASNSFKLLVDGKCFLVGDADSTALSSTEWTWINFNNGDTNSVLEVYLNSGEHAVKLIANEPNVSVDTLLFTPNKECQPTDTGENCLVAVEPDTTAPTVAMTAPAASATLAGDVEVKANAQDTSGINRVEFFVNGQLRTSDPESPHAFSWDTTTDSNGSYKLTAKAYDDSGNVGSSAEVTVNVSNTSTTPTPEDPGTPPTDPVTSGNTVVLAPIADSFVSAAESTKNFGTADTLQADGSPKNVTYLKYDLSSLSGKSLDTSKLRMKVTNGSSSAYELKGVADVSWSETALTYNNRPAVGAVLGKIYGTSEGSWADTSDLTSALTPNLGKTVTLAVESSGSDGFDFKSRNSTTEFPQLVVTLKGVTEVPQPTVPGAVSTLAFNVAEDATISSSSQDKNYGSDSTVVVDGDPSTQFLMKFNINGVAGKQVKSAKLRLYVTSKSDKGGSFHIAGNTWSQSSLTWKNAPVAGTKITELGAIKQGAWVEVDLTSYITEDGTYSVRVQPQSKDGADYSSSESDKNKPQLVLLVQ